MVLPCPRPSIRRSENDVRLLDVLIAIGPIFSVSRLIGKERTRRLESWLLARATDVGLSIRALPRLMVEPLLWLLAIVGMDILRRLFVDYVFGTGEGAPLATHPIVAIIFIPLLLYVNYRFALWVARALHQRIQALCAYWRGITTSAPPWPFDRLEGRRYRFSRMFWTMRLLPALVVLHTVVVPSALTVIAALLLPLWVAEKIRSKLTPEQPNALDILAYAISIVGVVVKLRSV